MQRKFILTTCLFALVAISAISAYAVSPQLGVTPNAAIVPEGSTMLFTAHFNDNSTIQACQWMTSAPNTVQGNYLNNPGIAVFNAGQTPGQYNVVAICSNTSGVTTVATAVVQVVAGGNH